MANLNLNGNISKNEEILNKAYGDLITFGKLFSPQDFLASATPKFHNKVGKLLIGKDIVSGGTMKSLRKFLRHGLWVTWLLLKREASEVSDSIECIGL